MVLSWYLGEQMSLANSSPRSSNPWLFFILKSQLTWFILFSEPAERNMTNHPGSLTLPRGLLSLTLCLSPCSHLPLPSEKFHKDPTNGECSMTLKASRASEPGSGMVGSSPGGLPQAYKLPEIRALHPSQEGTLITEFVQSEMTS